MCLLVAPAFAAALSCAPKANDPADVRAVGALMEGYFKAARSSDAAALDALLTDKTVLLEPNARPLVGKDAISAMHGAFFSAYQADMKAGVMRIESATLSDMRVHVAGDAAIVSLAGVATGTYKGKPFTDGSKGFDVFARRDGRWQVVYSQMTSIKP